MVFAARRGVEQRQETVSVFVLYFAAQHVHHPGQQQMSEGEAFTTCPPSEADVERYVEHVRLSLTPQMLEHLREVAGRLRQVPVPGAQIERGDIVGMYCIVQHANGAIESWSAGLLSIPVVVELMQKFAAYAATITTENSVQGRVQ